MNALERWLLSGLVRREIRQSYTHHLQLIELFRVIREEYEAEFPEDGFTTTSSNLQECLTLSAVPRRRQ